MTTARKRLVDPAVTRWYHCISRCVRRAFLLGDEYGGLTNRKAWIENRIEELSKVFAISAGGFSILDNHLHMLVRLDPEVAKGWSNAEVAGRWALLYPPRNRKREVVPVAQEWIAKRAADQKWIAKRREQLSSLSWYMKALKEPLARLANLQDDCDGAFWASRFKSIAVLDEAALLQVCAYIDLNPLAAGIAFLPEKSPYTSITQRVEHAWPKLTRADFDAAVRGLVVEHLPSGEAEQSHWLCPLEDRSSLGAAREGMLAGLSLPKYLLLLDHTARLLREGKATLDAAVAPILERLGTTAEVWQQRLTQLHTKFSCRQVTGRVLATSRAVLAEAARRFGRHHLVNLLDIDEESVPRLGPDG
jgi:hypothetical protein